MRVDVLAEPEDVVGVVAAFHVDEPVDQAECAEHGSIHFRLRAASDVYVILLTADAKEVDKLAGLAVGAVIG